ncbi:MAG TPA: hypothetical protein VKC56_03585 [Gallionellaceae bacterium]|nr:hypothetical protein [Gallionellaceae bacterium]
MRLRTFALLAAIPCVGLLAAAGYYFQWVPAHSAGQLTAFSTDGCSDFPDGTVGQRYLWLHCCIAHDKAYWAGGTYEERLAADHALETCVGKVGQPAIARLMLAGVRAGGAPWWPTRFRWGYGWPYSHAYRALTPAERQDAAQLLAAYDKYHEVQ